MIVTLQNARKIISTLYPDMPFRITKSCQLGVRPIYDPRPAIAWRKLDSGTDSAVKLGLFDGHMIDWEWDGAQP